MWIEIKTAGMEQLEDAAILFDAYRVFYKRPSDISAAKDFLQERLLKNESVVFIAYNENAAVGFCQLYPVFSSVGLQRTWLLNDLYVHESARGNGIATSLLRHAKAFGLETNARWLTLETGANNLTAQSLYEKNGWEKMGGIFYELRLD